MVGDINSTFKELRSDHYHSQEKKTQREDIPEDSIASLQEELAASKLREAESNLALKDLRSKVGELNSMWLKHIKTAESNTGTPEMPSTPKKFLGSLLEGKSGTAKLEEELMSTRLREVAGFAELKELRLRVMELETQVSLENSRPTFRTHLKRNLSNSKNLKPYYLVLQQMSKGRILKRLVFQGDFCPKHSFSKRL